MEIDALVRMANQIAANVAHHPQDQAIAEVEAHLRAFWAPSMRARLAEWVDEGGAGLDAVPKAAVERLGASR
jgi:formate dehydrogenase subunit delta